MIKRQTKDAFTLVEVLVSIAIIVFIGAVLLKIVSNNTFFIGNLLQKSSFNSFISVLNKERKDEKKKTIHIKDLVTSKYKNIDDELKEFLKKKKIEYSDLLISTQSMLDDNDTASEDEIEEQDDAGNIDFKVDIRKQIISIDDDKNQKSLEYLYYINEHKE